jgi:hypothetical protein
MRLRRAVPIATLIAAAAVLASVDVAFGCSLKWKAYQTALKSDLRNLVSAQEAFHDSAKRYSTDFRELGFKHSTGALPPRFDIVSDAGWSATNQHTLLDFPCHIYVGARPANAPANVGEGEPWCTPEYAWYDDARIGAPFAFGTVLAMAAFTLTSLVSFKRLDGRRNWAAGVLGALTAVQFLSVMVAKSCGDASFLGSLPLFLIGAFIFTVALGRRVRASA